MSYMGVIDKLDYSYKKLITPDYMSFLMLIILPHHISLPHVPVCLSPSNTVHAKLPSISFLISPTKDSSLTAALGINFSPSVAMIERTCAAVWKFVSYELEYSEAD